MRSIRIFILMGIVFMGVSARSFAQEPANCICGRWISADHDLIVDISKQHNDFIATIVWFNAGSEQKMEQWRDTNNPDPKLRSRKIIGMNILNNLQYQPSTDSFENGEVYDAMHGHTWNASVTVNKQGRMNVRGYWHFKFIGKTMSFDRVQDEASLNKKAPQQVPQRNSGNI
jgi:uncharacterized protein (DUF2147 family)